MTVENYSTATPGSFVDKLAVKKRQQMFQLFMRKLSPNAHDTILDVGVTADKAAHASNYFEKYYPHKKNIIAFSNQDATFLENIFPGIIFRQGDAKQLPFANNSIDFVFSSAVIEHLGSSHNQQAMLSECYRVARKAVFITTPNRWHPIEVHTLLPLLHWLPKKWHRQILKLLHLNFYAHEENLNLLDKKNLTKMCDALNISSFEIARIATFGITSNLVLIAKR